jgi:hypothetical protein
MINVITWIFQILKIATAIAIIVIVFYHLQNVHLDVNGLSSNVTFQCLLGPDYNGNSLCSYAYAGSCMVHFHDQFDLLILTSMYSPLCCSCICSLRS